MTHAPLRAVTASAYAAEVATVTEADGAPTWLTRGDHFVVATTLAKSGTTLIRPDNADEYMMILPPGVTATLQAGNERLEAGADSLTIVPPGASQVTMEGPGLVLRLFSTRAADLVAKADNADLYVDAPQEPPALWPVPIGGFKFRHYSLEEFPRSGAALIQPRIFRSTNLMVNVFQPFVTQRPTSDLRPHWHDDFDQGSVAVKGRWVHHVRTPWGADLSQWREDQHIEIDSPSVTIIPATLVHASRNIDKDACLIDVFAPPRLDFSQAGIVINGADYPMPEGTGPAHARDVPQAWQQATAQSTPTEPEKSVP